MGVQVAQRNLFNLMANILRQRYCNEELYKINASDSGYIGSYCDENKSRKPLNCDNQDVLLFRFSLVAD